VPKEILSDEDYGKMTAGKIAELIADEPDCILGDRNILSKHRSRRDSAGILKSISACAKFVPIVLQFGQCATRKAPQSEQASQSTATWAIA
jgi:hypothetical protein